MLSAQRPSYLDCWIAPGRTRNEFNYMRGKSLTTEDTFILLRMNVTGIRTIWVIHLLLHCLWIALGFVPGFDAFDGAAGEISALNHLGWWLIVDAIILAVGGAAGMFGLHYNKDGVIEKGIDNTLSFSWFYVALLVVGVASNLVHIGLTFVENANCTSTFCTQERSFLICLLVLLFLLSLFFCWQIYRMAAFVNNTGFTLAYKGNNMEMMGPNHERPVDDIPVPPAPVPSAPPRTVMAEPLLAKVARAKKLSHQYKYK